MINFNKTNIIIISNMYLDDCLTGFVYRVYLNYKAKHV